MIRPTLVTVVAFVLGTLIGLDAGAQHLWQEPKPPIPASKIEELIGAAEKTELSQERHILWVWGYDAWHRPGAHDYERVRDLMVGLLSKIPNATISTAYEFPSDHQFEQADLVCLYLHLPQLTPEQYQRLGAYLDRGGALVSIHESCIIRPSNAGKTLAEYLGRAWNEGQSQWGALFHDIQIDNQHPIFRNFPPTIQFVDEFYWNLHQHPKGVEVIATSPAGPDGDSKKPATSEELDGQEWPVVWTYLREQGRVFGTTIGHNTFSYYDPEFRLMLFRGMAWALNEDPAPFMPLVTDGITNESGLIGTTDDLRDWQDKQRGPEKLGAQ